MSQLNAATMLFPPTHPRTYPQRKKMQVFLGSLRGQPVAVKTLLEVNQTTVRAFRHEILITASLHHPNIINFKGATWGRDLSVCLYNSILLID